MPLPPTDFFITVVDVLASRYGWSYTEISENMYWEQVYEFYEYASNMEAMDKQERMKFEHAIHAQSQKALDSWEDEPIPYPDRRWKPPVDNKNSVSSLPASFRSKITPSKKAQTPEEKKRIQERVAYIKQKQKETQEKLRKAEAQRMYQGYNT